MTIKKLKNGAVMVGAIALTAFLLSPFILTAPPTDAGLTDYVLPFAEQWVDADTLGGSGNTAFAQAFYKVWEAKMNTFNYSRTQMSAVYGDTSGEKLVVPGMSAGDIVTSVLYIGEDGIINTKYRDMTDSTWYSADSIMIGAYTDSGTVLVLFQDRTD